MYASESDLDSLLVSKLDSTDDNLHVMKTWNISVSRRDYGNGFIVCGVLYLVSSVTSETTIINYAYDLYTRQRLENVNIKFYNPYKMNIMIAYNPLERKIYSWDRGNQLVYPLLVDPLP